MASRLEELMQAHLAAPFPQSIEKGTNYGDIEPVLIGADIYGWALHVSSGTTLGVIERPRLEAAREDLARSLDAVPGDARTYYQQLLDLADEALTQDQTRR